MNGQQKDATLANGTAGLAVFFSYLATTWGEPGDAETATTLLERSIDALAAAPMTPGLFDGFTGIGWMAEHLDGRTEKGQEKAAVQGDADQASAEIDEAVDGFLRRPGDFTVYDLISGWAGWGIYALERMPSPWAREFLEALVLRFEELAVSRPEGISWPTPPWLRTHLKSQSSDSCEPFNLGVAHGVPAVIAVLASIYGAGVARRRAWPLLEDAVAWLLAQRLPSQPQGPCFTNWSGAGASKRPSRLAWCYGDPGVAAVLLLASRRVGREDWERHALDIALCAAHRPAADSGVRDAGLCHGSAGLGHLFNRLYQATGEPRLAHAARFWFLRTLEQRRQGEGIAGFAAYTRKGEAGGRVEPGFLAGAAGIGLALLAAVCEHEPQWDRILLTSVSPKEGS